MKWQQISAGDQVDHNDAPRRLTEEEIHYVTSHLPAVMGGDALSSELARDGIIDWLQKILRTCQLCPSALPALKDRLVAAHHSSLVIPGTPVGITAAESVSAVTMQMTLNTFHSSGSSKSVTGSIDSIRDLIFARNKPKNPVCTIHYRNKRITYRQVLDSRHYIVGSMFMDFVNSYEIERVGALSKSWWHEFYPEATGRGIPTLEARRVLRLYLNTSEMYRQHVSIAKLADILRRESTLTEGQKKVPLSVIPVYGPGSDGIIDIYPTYAVADKAIRDLFPHTGNSNQDLVEMVFLETVVIPVLQKIRVKGVAGIARLYPTVMKVWDIVLRELPVSESEHAAYYRGQDTSTLWVLVLNTNFMRSTGLSSSNLLSLCTRIRLHAVGVNESGTEVIIDSGQVGGRKPSACLQSALQQEKADREALKTSQTPQSLGARAFGEPGTLQSESEYVYATTEGIGEGFRDLLALPEIDKARTTCNNMHVIASAFGIEAARSFLVRQLNDAVMSSSAYINPANVATIAELITSRGECFGATYGGISRQPFGHLSLATLERAGKTFIQGALVSANEDELGVSACIAVGCRCKVGNGSFEIGCVDPRNPGEYLINEDIFNAYKRTIAEEDFRERDAHVTRNMGKEIDAMDLDDLLEQGGGYLDNLVSGSLPLHEPEDENKEFVLPPRIVEAASGLREPRIVIPLAKGFPPHLLSLLSKEVQKAVHEHELKTPRLFRAAERDDEIGEELPLGESSLPDIDDLGEYQEPLFGGGAQFIDTQALVDKLGG